MKRIRKLRDSEKGAAVVEFAIVAPVLLSFIFGIAQLGVLFMANAGLRSSVAEGARLASIYPRPSDAAILARVNERRVGMTAQYVTGPTITHGTANGASFVDISMSYAVPLDFIFFETSPVTLTETRRVFTYAPTTGTTSASSATSAGGTTTSSGTSAGGTTTTSASGGTTTSASGGTTTTSSTSSTGGTTTSTTSGGTTSSTSSTSSGNGNGNGNGHGHDHGTSSGNGNGKGKGN